MIGADAFWGYVSGAGVPFMQALYLGYVILEISSSQTFSKLIRSQDVAGVVPNTRINTLTGVSGMRNGSYTTLFFTRNGSEGLVFHCLILYL